MIPRDRHIEAVQQLLREFPVVGLIGARQVGKTTLAALVADEEPDPVTVFDLEHPEDRARLREPLQALEPLSGLVVLDEVQHHPDLFAVLRVLADRRDTPARFLVLGSASPDLLRQSSESLAGRIAYHDLGGLDLSEVGSPELDRLWVRGGFPRSFLAKTDAASVRWRQQFIRTYLERDLGALALRLPSEPLRRFLNMVAHYHARIWNGSAVARSIDASESTARRYLDVLCSTFLAYRLQPWSANIAKRQVKSPKVYLTDSGLLHAVLGVTTRHELLGHPKLGDSWEGFAIGELCRRLEVEAHERFFWAVHTGAELDLLIVRGRTRLGFEIKFTDSPRVTKSMRAAKETLELDEVVVVYPGKSSFPLADNFRAVALSRVDQDVEPLA